MLTAKVNTELKINEMLQEAFTIRVSNLVKSIDISKQALRQSKQIGNDTLMAKSLSRLSFYYMIYGELEQAITIANEAIQLFELLKDELGAAEAKFNIASVYYKSDKLHLGLKYLLDCITVFQKYNEYASLAKSYKALGTIYEYFADVENAMDCYNQSILAAEKIEDVNLKTNVYNPLSGIYLNQNKFTKALEMIELSIKLKKQTNDIRGLAFSYYGRGKIYAKTNEYLFAEADYKKAIEIHIEMGEKLGLGLAYQKMAMLYFSQNKILETKEMAAKALLIGEQYNIRLINTKSNYLMYEVYKIEGNLEKALKYLETYHERQRDNLENQTFQIIDSYKKIHILASNSLEAKLLLEKSIIIQEKEKAESIAKAKQDFLSNMSHEIRTPLNAVITITNLLKERADEEDQQLLESLTFASNNLLLLINDVLDFSKLETDKIQLENRPANLKFLLTNIKNTYESLAKEKGLSLTLKVDDNLDEVFELDEIKLAQILGNLLSNAIKFTEKGNVSLIVEKASKVGDLVKMQFKVKDTGLGISNDFLKYIFDSFSQPKSVTTKKQSGSGLGLAIVKKLVAIYGSEIFIKTKIGEGSTFYFDLLLKTGTQKIDLEQNDTAALQHLKVLLAEDNKINMLVARKLLQRWGIVIDEAQNGIEAIAKAEQKKYDVILMDIHMPELNGYDACKQIRETNNINNTTHIYAFTADIIANIQEEYSGLFNGFLLKPIQMDELYRVLHATNKN
jgi:signal transduction histidine kinase/CheY-like chemotaxis protein